METTTKNEIQVEKTEVEKKVQEIEQEIKLRGQNTTFLYELCVKAQKEREEQKREFEERSSRGL